ncbi:hypothetical protein GGR39_001065 [Novosphingobium fluoreni]|uniref:Uncharacterized protein n=1 Tax=Novosphingobium fluoreni TaxID=1391222 RepID=A0A7W6BZP0_9SPHN|nr:hypothetical protein [Novosphingobium fluoreni]MBB3939425.1 hypothetical protein [Novosphingobium fluoreni]
MSGPRKRGQPLVVLAALLLGWVGARVSTIGGAEASSLPTVSRMVATSPSANIAAARVDHGNAREHIGLQSYPMAVDSALYPEPAYGAGYPTVVYYLPAPGGYSSARPSPAMRYTTQTDRLAGLPQEQRDRDADTSRMYVTADYPGQPIGRMALEDGGTLPLGFTGAPQARPGLQVPQYGKPNALLGSKIGRLIGDKRRWSMDAWTLLRKSGGRVPRAGTLPATYGASQAGAVLRYRIAMDDPRRPTAYLRTTSSVGAINETTAALGLSARPIPRLPVVAALEGRVTAQGGSRRVQPVAMAVTELPPIPLPGALRAEAYGQAGYVAGRYATPFADGQLRVDRSLLTVGRVEARAGGGVWGGIQKGASRVDAGPGATVSMPLTSKVFGRLAVDWRFRVAGNAEPGSGPAVTVAAGF